MTNHPRLEGLLINNGVSKQVHSIHVLDRPWRVEVMHLLACH